MGDFTQMIEMIQPCGALKRVENFVDEKGINITALTDVEGITVYQSMIQVTTTAGPLNIGFAIKDAASPADAADKWQACAKDALREAGKMMKENERRIVLPSAANEPAARAPFTMHKPLNGGR